MAEAKVLSGAGLRGQSAGQTALCTCGVSGAGLTYRGYDIKDLADNAQFEEVAHLLLYGKLPNQAELDAYKARLKGMRALPAAYQCRRHQCRSCGWTMGISGICQGRKASRR